jgi:hypothetical protein
MKWSGATPSAFIEATYLAKKGFNKIYIYFLGVHRNGATRSEHDASKTPELLEVSRGPLGCPARELCVAIRWRK